MLVPHGLRVSPPFISAEQVSYDDMDNGGTACRRMARGKRI